MSIKENIKFYREKLNISQRELGRRIGKTGQLISSIEQGKSTPSMETLKNIAKTLEVDINQLLYEEDALKELEEITDYCNNLYKGNEKVDKYTYRVMEYDDSFKLLEFLSDKIEDEYLRKVFKNYLTNIPPLCTSDEDKINTLEENFNKYIKPIIQELSDILELKAYKISKQFKDK